jgi:outer membrane receptor protein involved in Fe transport
MLSRGLCPAFLLLAALSPLAAQNFGEVTGTVRDPTGAVVANADVRVINMKTGQIREVLANESGNYDVPFLVPGIYEVQARHEGFKSATRRQVELQVGDVARVDFALELGGVTEVIEVSGGAPLLATENAAVGTVIENRRIVELPLNGRNYLQMIALSTNVAAEQRGGGEATSRKGGERPGLSFSIAGQRNQFNRFTLDGVENTAVSYNLFAIRPSIDALQEFNVQTGVYSAEYGRATAQVTVATKSGSNEFHGTVFEFHRNENLDAKEWKQEGEKNPFVRNQFGFTFGGRLIKDKLFFMSNFESTRERKTLQGTANVAPARMRAGDFTASGRLIFDPMTRVYTTTPQGTERAVSAAPFPGNMVPENRLNPIALKLLEFYPEATRPGDNILANYIRQRPRPISTEQFTQRMDFNESATSSWFGRFSWGDEFSQQLAAFQDQETSILTKTYQAMISNTRTFSASFVNEFRFGYTQFQNDQLRYYAFERDITAELAIPGLPSPVEASWGTPAIGMGLGLSGWGEEGNGPFVEDSHIFQWLDNVSLIRGNHALKFGGEVRRDRFNETGNAFTRGNFNFEEQATMDPARRGTTGHRFADYLLGWARVSQRARTFSNGLFRATSFAWYVEDTWKITPRLTMNLGLRYENTPPYHDKYRSIMNVKYFDLGVGPNGLLEGSQVPIMVRPGEGDFHEGLPFHMHDGMPTASGDDILGRATVYRDNNDLAPRVGLAFRPTDRWTVRAGAGYFFAQDIAEVRFDLTRNLGGRSQFISDDERPNSNLSDPWIFERENYTCTGWTGQCQGPTFMLANDVNLRTPYVLQYLFNVQRQIGDDTSLEIGYMGNNGHKLQRLMLYNQPINRRGPNDFSTRTQRTPWPAYGLIQTVAGTVNSNYNAFNIKLRQRFAHGLTYLAGFTWSKAIDAGSAVRAQDGDENSPPSSYDMHSERGLSQFHQGRRVVASVLYELPFGRGQRFANNSAVLHHIAGGWQVGSIVTFGDGTPREVGTIGDRNDTARPTRPDATGVSPIPDNRSADQFWNIAAFNTTNPELSYRDGNTARNALIGPGLRSWDFSLNKNIMIRESHSLQFRFEAFNFSNHPNWNPPSNNPLTAATFGRVVSARTMRELQLGLKYVF